MCNIYVLHDIYIPISFVSYLNNTAGSACSNGPNGGVPEETITYARVCRGACILAVHLASDIQCGMIGMVWHKTSGYDIICDTNRPGRAGLRIPSQEV